MVEVDIDKVERRLSFSDPECLREAHANLP